MTGTPSEERAVDRDRSAALGLLQRLQPALREDDRAGIVAILQRLVDLAAPMAGQWPALARIAADNGEIGLARRAMDLFVASTGDAPEALYQKAGLLAHIGAWAEARAVMRALPADEPDPASQAHSLGTAALFLGDVEEARARLEEALRLRPRSGLTWQSLATLVDFAREPELAERIDAATTTMEAAAPAERGVFHYALGKAHADRGEHALAFDAFAKGARDIRATRPYSRERDSRIAGEAVKGYDADRIAAIAGRQSEPTGRTIFVTGLPRSGTTLVEQILTGHSAVSDGGELNRLGLLVKDVRGVSYEALCRHIDETGAPATARLWRHWLDERFPGQGRIVDKTVNSTRMLGLAAALLPEAPLIWMRRDPLDCAWSCFRTYFLGLLPWSYDLEDIAFHFRLEDRLLEQWREILEHRLLVVPYESLVDDPVTWIRRILRHCGLDEEPGVFAPHENRRAVTTSSVMQVRKPINRGAIGSAAPYRQFLEPFLAAYRD